MRGAKNITTGETEVVAAGINWNVATLHNNSDTTVFYQYTAESDALTISNGIPLASGAKERIVVKDPIRRGAIKAIHGGSGNKEVRYAVE